MDTRQDRGRTDVPGHCFVWGKAGGKHREGWGWAAASLGMLVLRQRRGDNLGLSLALWEMPPPSGERSFGCIANKLPGRKIRSF